MTRDDGLQVLRVFTAAWPARELSDDTIELWLIMLEPLDADHAETTARHLVGESKYFPTVAEFRERYGQVLRRAELDRPRNELTEPVLSPEENLARLAEAKKALGK